MRIIILILWYTVCMPHKALAVRSRANRGEVRPLKKSTDFKGIVQGQPKKETTCRTYMVEFRGHYRDFREQEFFDNLEFALLSAKGTSTCNEQFVKEHIQRIWNSRKICIPDKSSAHVPLCVYIDTDADINTVALAASRCSLLRSVSRLWGEGSTPESANKACMENFDSIIAPTYYEDNNINGKANDWRVSFRRYGRSAGWNTTEKVALLAKFNPTLKALGGDVDLKGAAHDLIYLEDWHSFHREMTLKEQTRGRTRERHSTPRERIEGEVKAQDRDRDHGEYAPLKSILGEIIFEPVPVESLFSLGKRPFLGTTSMTAVSAHLASVAANAGIGRRVLDPFCGTGSLILSSAYLGAEVVGSDIDATCIGLGHDDDDVSKFKNQNFRRYGAMEGFDQSNKSTIDNFVHYGLADQVGLLAGCDVQSWLSAFLNPNVPQLRPVYGGEGPLALPLAPFDAICCDPPYSRRERASGAVQSSLELKQEVPAAVSYPLSPHMGDPRQVLSTLLQLAQVSLKPGGRLVFWFPSAAFLSESEIREQLRAVETAASGSLQQASPDFHEKKGMQLRLMRVTPEKMHDKLWRWLVVYEALTQ